MILSPSRILEGIVVGLLVVLVVELLNLDELFD